MSSRPSFSFRLLLLFLGLHVSTALNSEQRSELVRKFKYYHRSIRPSDRFNLLETVNGTFFALNLEFDLLATTSTNEVLEVELALGVHFHDERLIIRDLEEVMLLPDEFEPWKPILELSEQTNLRVSMHLDPQTGQMSLRYNKVRASLVCRSLTWTKPFELYACELSILTDEDERLFLKILRDLRTERQMQRVRCQVDQWPTFVLQCTYRNSWLSSVVKTFLPSVLIFTVCVFAQWKRRKMQVFVTLGSLIALMLLQTTNEDSGSSFTMQDLWMLGTFLHLITLLSIDLVLPARRLIRTTYTTLNESVSSSALNGASVDQKRVATPVYKKTIRRLLHPTTISAYPGHNKESPVFSRRLPPAHHDLDVEMADEDEDADLNRMRTTLIHVQRSPTRPPHSTTPSTTTTSKTRPTDSLSASATTVTSRSGSGTTTTVQRAHLTSTTSPIRSRQLVTRWSIGRKKRVALIAILGCYVLFVFSYTLLALYILR